MTEQAIQVVFTLSRWAIFHHYGYYFCQHYYNLHLDLVTFHEQKRKWRRKIIIIGCVETVTRNAHSILKLLKEWNVRCFFLNRKKAIAFPKELNFLFTVVYLSDSFFKTKRKKNSKNQPYKYVRIHSIRI